MYILCCSNGYLILSILKHVVEYMYFRQTAFMPWMHKFWDKYYIHAGKQIWIWYSSCLNDKWFHFSNNLSSKQSWGVCLTLFEKQSVVNSFHQTKSGSIKWESHCTCNQSVSQSRLYIVGNQSNSQSVKQSFNQSFDHSILLFIQSKMGDKNNFRFN